MSNLNYQSIITVNNTPAAAYKALTEGFEFWWTKPDKPIYKTGDAAKFTFPPGKSFWTFEATVLQPDKRIEMQCIDAMHMHEGQPEAIEREWLGTTVIWKITPDGESTVIQLEHVGLMPNLYCYDICQDGWDYFFTKSLKAYMNNGIGQPHEY